MRATPIFDELRKELALRWASCEDRNVQTTDNEETPVPKTPRKDIPTSTVEVEEKSCLVGSDVRETEAPNPGQYVNPGAEISRRYFLGEEEGKIGAATGDDEQEEDERELLGINREDPIRKLPSEPVIIGYEQRHDDGTTTVITGPATFETSDGITTVTIDDDGSHTEVREGPSARNIIAPDEAPPEAPLESEELAEARYEAAYREGVAAGMRAAQPRTAEVKLLFDAAQTINGERQDQYGKAEDSFQVIADFWNTYLSAKSRTPVDISPFDVAMMMDLLKTARLTQSPDHRDSLVDKAGYVALGWRALNSDASPAR